MNLWLVCRVPPVAMALLMLAASSTAWAQAPDVPAAYYSDACFSVASGDLRGDRVALVKSPEGYVVRFQSIQGALPPEDTAKATVEGDALAFEVISRGARLAFRGRITPDEITGRFSDGRPGSDGKPEIRWQRLAIDVFATGDCPAPPR